MDEPIVTVMYKPKATDYQRVLWHRQRKTVWIVLFGLLLLGSVFIGVWFIRAEGQPLDYGSAVRIVLPFAVGGAVLFWGLYLRPRNLARKIAANLEATKFDFMADEFVITTSRASSRAQWETFKRAEETESDIILFSQINTMFPISKAHLNQKELNQVRVLLAEKLGNRAQLKA